MFFCISIGIVYAIDINDCGTLDVAGETYTLTKDVNINWTTCIIITAADITLDCNGFSVHGNGAVNSYNIYSMQRNTTLKHCNISVPTPDNINIVENIPKTALFDIVSEIATEPKKSGEDLIVKVSLINFGASTTIDAHLAYTISDSKGKIITQHNKLVPVTTQTEFLDHINTTGLANGKYTLKIQLRYAGQVYPASTEKVFYVGEGLLGGVFRNTSLKTFILPAITLIMLLGVYRKNQMNKLKENMDLKESSENNSNYNNGSSNVEKLNDYKIK